MTTPPLTAQVSAPSPVPERPEMYVVLGPATSGWFAVGPVTDDKARADERHRYTPCSVMFALPGSSPTPETQPAEPTDEQKRLAGELVDHWYGCRDYDVHASLDARKSLAHRIARLLTSRPQQPVQEPCNGSCDIALARRQVGPDGVVPGCARECAELWEREASRLYNLLRIMTEDRDGWKREWEMFANAWSRELGDRRGKTHLIDELVVATRDLRENREKYQAVIAAQAEAERKAQLDRDIAALDTPAQTQQPAGTERVWAALNGTQAALQMIADGVTPAQEALCGTNWTRDHIKNIAKDALAASIRATCILPQPPQPSPSSSPPEQALPPRPGMMYEPHAPNIQAVVEAAVRELDELIDRGTNQGRSHMIEGMTRARNDLRSALSALESEQAKGGKGEDWKVWHYRSAGELIGVVAKHLNDNPNPSPTGFWEVVRLQANLWLAMLATPSALSSAPEPPDVKEEHKGEATRKEYEA